MGVCACLTAPMVVAADERDWLDLASGAVVLSATSEFDRHSWSALGLLDGTGKTGWASRKGETGPNTIVVELARPVTLRRFAVDARGVDGPNRGARAFELHGSSASATQDFRRLLAAELPRDGRGEYAVKGSVPVRWLKLVVKSNWGATDYTEIMELEARGTPVDPTPGADVSGVYSTNYGALWLVQQGNRVSGCYRSDATVVGSTDGRVIQFEWREAGSRVGTAVMVLNAANDRLNGQWFEHGRMQGSWFGERAKPGQPATCKLPSEASVQEVLATSGRTTLYGIYFDTDKDTLRAESDATLNRVLAALKARPDWRLVIAGHTDTTGTETRNRELSRLRAQSVMRWLAAKDIAADRLEALGHGAAQPVADNATPQGRALNRRVEISLKR